LTVEPGSRLGPYEILAPLGAGGMGEVWRALDTRLSREVAIKVLPADVANDASRLKRFEKEARAASALNHPNIVTIYDIGSFESTSYIAMERVDGRTLRETLLPGPLPLKRLLPIAAQIADGLARAHEAGIVHRDLKPENVMVTKDGLVKILDFGLAKRMQSGSGSDEASHLPTETGTSPGMVMGTVGYMSPEQAAGQPLDFRSDQFALGSILYEMATGKRAFQKKTAVDTLSAILHEEPEPVGDLNPQAPAPFRWIVERCLAKEPDGRYVSTRDLGRDLAGLRDRLSEASASGRVSAVDGSRPRRAIGLMPATALLLVLLAAGFYAGRLSKGTAPSMPRFKQVTFGNFTISKARFAPDGQTVVYSVLREGGVELLTARAGTPEFRSLGIADAEIHSISSLGDMAITLSTKGHFPTLARASLAGGAPREILENTVGASWAPDGKSLAVVHLVGEKYRLEFPIGRVLYETNSEIGSPVVSPNGDRVAFLENSLISVVDARGRKKTLARKFEDRPIWSPSGKELWFGESKEGATLLGAITLDGRERLIASVPGDFALQDVFRDGRLLIERGFERWQSTGEFPGENGERNLSFLDATLPVDLSADGKVLLFSEKQPGWSHASVYVRKTDGSQPVHLGEGFGLALSPDGKWALTVPELPGPRLVLLPTGAGEARPLPNEERLTYVVFGGGGWLPDGKSVLYSAVAPGRPPRIYAQDITGGRPRPISPEGVRMGPGYSGISPDGKSVIGTAGGRPALYSLEGGPTRSLSLSDGDTPIRWTADGKSLYVFEPGGSQARISLVDLSSGRKRLWKEFDACGHSGAHLHSVRLTPDGTARVVTCSQWLSNLYFIEGLR
jgi:serine/threonine protein kinase/Tol biopolymer transport system component